MTYQKTTMGAAQLLSFYFFSRSTTRLHADYMCKDRLAVLVNTYLPRISDDSHPIIRKAVLEYCFKNNININEQ